MKIDIDITNKAVTCNFSKKCLEDMDTSLCCEIVERKPLFLLVRPASTFKSSNCSYRRTIKNDTQEVHVCSCPIRIEIYDKLGK